MKRITCSKAQAEKTSIIMCMLCKCMYEGDKDNKAGQIKVNNKLL